MTLNESRKFFTKIFSSKFSHTRQGWITYGTTSQKFYHEIFILEQNSRNHESFLPRKFFAMKVWSYMVHTYHSRQRCYNHHITNFLIVMVMFTLILSSRVVTMFMCLSMFFFLYRSSGNELMADMRRVVLSLNMLLSSLAKLFSVSNSLYTIMCIAIHSP